jgi:MoxR-vWA-beta-propeller ternary system domain bpX4
MATLGDFLQTLFDEGRIVLRGRPIPQESDHASALSRLEAAFQIHRLDVAGPPIPFDGPRALLAAELVRQSSWFLINRSESVETMERFLIWPRPPRTASEHLSADLTFRFLPRIQRRSRSIAPGDRLASFLADLLRAWPLSGVLSDIPEGPKDVGDLGGHVGLWMLYAERLARDEKPAWMPRGPAREYVELVFRGLGKGRSSLLAQPTEAVGVDVDVEGVVRGG